MTRVDDLLERAVVSGFLALCLGLQTAASFGVFHGLGWRWPFLDYPMYSDTFVKGDVMPVWSLVGLGSDGIHIPIKATDLNQDYWEFLSGPIRAATRGDSVALRQCLLPFCERTRIRLCGVQLLRTPYVLDRNIERRADEVATNFYWEAMP
jgi:hypothetical protein